MEQNKELISRADEVKRFIKILTDKDKVSNEIQSFNVALNGRWGDGKTTFVNQLKEQIKNNNTNPEMKYENIFTINAWDYDFLDDPSEMFYHFLEENNENQLLSKIYSVLKGCATEYIISKFNLLKIVSKVVKSNQENAAGKQKQLLSIFELKKKIKSALIDVDDNIYIFIDDLDRCNPNFVIKLIELTKHIFDVKNITIIYMLDWENTNTSIMNHYGFKTDYDDNEKYLSKIIDRKWDLPHLSKEEYLYKKYLSNTFSSGNKEVYSQYERNIKNITFREAERVTIKFRTCINYLEKQWVRSKDYDVYMNAYLSIYNLILYRIIKSSKNEIPNIDPLLARKFFEILFNSYISDINYNLSKSEDINLDNPENMLKVQNLIFKFVDRITN